MVAALFQTLLFLSFSKYAIAASCTSNNCLNALRNHAVSASSFCTPYLASTQTATTWFPTFLSPCSAVPSKLSSCCSCILAATTSSVTSSKTSTKSSTTSPTIAPSCTATTTITPLASTVTVISSASCTAAPSTCPSASTITSVSTVTTTVTTTALPTCSLAIVSGNFEAPSAVYPGNFEVAASGGILNELLATGAQNALIVPSNVDQFLFLNFEGIVVASAGSAETYTLQQFVGTTCAPYSSVTLTATVLNEYGGPNDSIFGIQGSISFCISPTNCSPVQALSVEDDFVSYSATFLVNPGTPITATLNLIVTAVSPGGVYFAGIGSFSISTS